MPAFTPPLRPAWRTPSAFGAILSLRVYTVAAGLCIVLLLCGAVLVTWSSRATMVAEAKRSLAQLGVALAAQTSRSMQGVELALDDTVNRLSEGGVTLRPGFGRLMGTQEVHNVLRERLHSIPQADAISVVDATGRLMNFTRSWPPPVIELADRDYFQFLRDNAGARTFISAPVRNRGNDTWTVYLARRLSAPDGEFLGVVLGAVSLSYVEEFFRAVTLNAEGSVTLRRGDGVLLARFPRQEGLIGGRPAQGGRWEEMIAAGGGTFESVTGPDGVDELVSTNLLADYPLVVQVATTERAALTRWRRQSWAILACSLLAAACMAKMLQMGAQRLSREREVQRSLARRNEELEATRVRLEARSAELVQTAETLRERERRVAETSQTLQTTLENIEQGVMMVDSSQVVAVYNKRVVEIMDLSEELLARRPAFSEVLASQWNTNEFAKTSQDVVGFIKAGGIRTDAHVYERERPNGRVIEIRSLPLPGGGVVRTYTDVTERKQAEAKVRYAAHHDALTGLANRVVLQEHLERAIADTTREPGLALLFLDLDRFKLINDAQGHEVGDRLLIEVAKRMRSMVRDVDLVARMGGDEFAIVQTAVHQPEAASALAERLVELISTPFVISGLRLTIGVSVGIAVFPGAGTDGETLRRNADIAMYRAKEAGRNTYRLYEPAMSEWQQGQFLLEQDLREAVQQHDFHLAYQPIVSAETGAVVGYEALLRWTHPARGPVSPQDFVALAETTGLIVPLGRWVLEAACREAATWPDHLRIAVNLSPVQFRHGRLAAEIADILAQTGLPPGRLELEVTEGVLLEASGPVLDTMTALHDSGISINLDDFGTGNASLSYLRRFPFDKIKIDKSFVRNLGRDPQSDAIVEAILLLSRRLDLLVVAEGVETPDQVETLRRLRCPLVQGYFTGRPMTPDQARAASGRFLLPPATAKAA